VDGDGIAVGWISGGNGTAVVVGLDTGADGAADDAGDAPDVGAWVPDDVTDADGPAEPGVDGSGLVGVVDSVGVVGVVDSVVGVVVVVTAVGAGRCRGTSVRGTQV
jgi:hypothetical protein